MEVAVKNLIDEIIDREGGYVNHPADRGGSTKFGITQAVARTHGYDGDMHALPREVASEIYLRCYWLNPRFDAVAALAPVLARELFDSGVNMGTGRAVSFLQRSLNALNRNETDYDDLSVDRIIGGKTLSALSAFLKKRGSGAETVLLKAVEALQGAHYLRLAETRPSQEAFLYGWLANRIGQN
jgi:lysozyme family protein